MLGKCLNTQTGHWKSHEKGSSRSCIFGCKPACSRVEVQEIARRCCPWLPRLAHDKLQVHQLQAAQRLPWIRRGLSSDGHDSCFTILRAIFERRMGQFLRFAPASSSVQSEQKGPPLRKYSTSGLTVGESCSDNTKPAPNVVNEPSVLACEGWQPLTRTMIISSMMTRKVRRVYCANLLVWALQILHCY